MFTVVDIGTVMPLVRNENSHVFTLHYDVTNFIRAMEEKQSIFNETEHLLESLWHRLSSVEVGYLEAQESFANTLCNKLRDTRPIYKAMNYLKTDDITRQLGRPVKTRIVFEIILDKSQVKLQYSECLDINNISFSGDEKQSFDILTNDSKLGSKDNFRETKEETYTRIQSHVFLTQFQEDVIKLAENIALEMQQDPSGRQKLICFRKHDTGICVVMEYKTEGILIDLIPVVSFDKLQNETKTKCNKYDPKHQARRLMEVNGCESSMTGLFLLCESDKLAGSWSLSTLYRDHKVLKWLPEGVRNAFETANYIVQMYLLGNKPELDPIDPMFIGLKVNFMIILFIYKMICLISLF